MKKDERELKEYYASIIDKLRTGFCVTYPKEILDLELTVGKERALELRLELEESRYFNMYW